MNSHPHVAARFLTQIETDVLIEAVVSDVFCGHEWRLLRVLLLAELAYRMRVRAPDFPARIWREVFGRSKPVPPGFTSPSEAWPHERRWALH